MIGEDSVQLRLKASLENRTEFYTGLHPQGNKVTTLHNRLWNGIPNLQTGCLFRQPFKGLAVFRKWRTSRRIGCTYTDKAVDRTNPERQPTYGRIPGIPLPHRIRKHMALYKRRHLFQKALLIRKPFEERKRRLHTLHIVSKRAYAIFLAVKAGTERLSEIMAQNGKSNHQILMVVGAEMPFGGKCVQAAAGMVPDITFRMPFGFLFAAYKPG